MTEEHKTTETDDHASHETPPVPVETDTPETGAATAAEAEPAHADAPEEAHDTPQHDAAHEEPHAEPAVEPETAAEPAPEVEPEVEPVVVPAEAAEPVAAHEGEPAHEPAPEPEHTTEPAPAEAVTAPAEPIAAAAALAAASSGAEAPSSRRPVWSDEGDAPDHSGDDDGDDGDNSDGGKTKNEGLEILKTVVIALIIAVLLRIFLFQPFTIPSASMEPNLYEGDYIVVSKWTYGYSKHAIPYSPPLFEGRILNNAPERGDIVVFKLPRDNKTDYIKRVIGLPGDRVQMINNVLHINGTAVEDVVISSAEVSEMFAGQTATQLRETLPGGRTFTIQDFGPNYSLDNTPVFEVPEGYYFMMGDNRDNSIDSREQSAMGVGLVPEENLIGKAEMILFSWKEGASLWNPISWFSKVNLDRFFTVLK
jgi:signal peptidase I